MHAFFNDRELQRLYKEKFMLDFSKEAIEGRPITNSLEKLRNWVDYLHTKVTLRTEQYSSDGYSQELASYVPKKIEMFGCNYIKNFVAGRGDTFFRMAKM